MRWILRIAFLALSALLALWVWEGLLLVDRHGTLIPLPAGGDGGDMVMIVAGPPRGSGS